MAFIIAITAVVAMPMVLHDKECEDLSEGTYTVFVSELPANPLDQWFEAPPWKIFAIGLHNGLPVIREMPPSCAEHPTIRYVDDHYLVVIKRNSSGDYCYELDRWESPWICVGGACYG
ncbi:MAG: hypothetical protein NTY61_03535 [Candidatus Parcubacteria bacterium]|nr:hypothetical protein [Candidatus Parcubacteria bacterium]